MIALVIVILFLAIYLNHYLTSKREERISNSHDRRQQHLEETMERIREADRKRADDNGKSVHTDTTQQ
jgi:hypothetical protein